MVRELGFDSIAAATPGMLYTPGDGFWIQRTYWRFGETVEWNAKNFRVNGEMWVKLTSRSPIG